MGSSESLYRPWPLGPSPRRGQLHSGGQWGGIGPNFPTAFFAGPLVPSERGRPPYDGFTSHQFQPWEVERGLPLGEALEQVRHSQAGSVPQQIEGEVH